MDDYKIRNQIPAFGNWDYADGLPITQYFQSVESARQAGFFRHSYGDRDLYGGVHKDLYQDDAGDDDLKKHVSAPITVVPCPRKVKGTDRRYGQAKEPRKQGRVCDLTNPARKQQSRPLSPAPAVVPPRRAPKAVDEDLYKIPPELLYSNNPKRKKAFGFFSCLVPSCAA